MIKRVMVNYVLLVCLVLMTSVNLWGATAGVSKNSPSAKVAFKNSSVDESIERKLKVGVSGVLKRVDPGRNDLATPWLTGTWSKNTSSSVTYSGLQKAKQKAKSYQPKFSGRAGPAPGEGGGGTNQDYEWKVDGQYELVEAKITSTGNQALEQGETITLLGKMIPDYRIGRWTINRPNILNISDTGKITFKDNPAGLKPIAETNATIIYKDSVLSSVKDMYALTLIPFTRKGTLDLIGPKFNGTPIFGMAAYKNAYSYDKNLVGSKQNSAEMGFKYLPNNGDRCRGRYTFEHIFKLRVDAFVFQSTFLNPLGEADAAIIARIYDDKGFKYEVSAAVSSEETVAIPVTIKSIVISLPVSLGSKKDVTKTTKNKSENKTRNLQNIAGTDFSQTKTWRCVISWKVRSYFFGQASADALTKITFSEDDISLKFLPRIPVD